MKKATKKYEAPAVAERVDLKAQMQTLRKSGIMVKLTD